MDESNWPATLSLIAYGVHIGLRADSEEVLDRCSGYLPVGWKPSSAGAVDRLYSIVDGARGAPQARARYRLLRGCHTIAESCDVTEIFERFEADSALYVAEMSPRRVFVHAGVVGWGGRAILIPGRSYAGKSTLTAALVRAGASYYSDEFAVVDRNGMVHPYARPLQMRASRGARQSRLPVDHFGGVAGHVPMPVGLILLSQFKPGATWRPRHLSPGEALLGILANTVSARRAPAIAMRSLKAVVSDGFAVKGFRGDAQEVVDWISRHFHQQTDWTRPGS